MTLRGISIALALALTGPALAISTDEQAAFEAAIEDARAFMMRDPNAALEAAQRAAEAAGASAGETDAHRVALADWLQAEALMRLGRHSEAGPIAERALELLGPSPEPTKLYGDLLVARGRIAMAAPDYETAFVAFTEAYDAFRAIGETRSQAIVLQSLASLYTDAKQYERALEYLDSAVERYSDPSLNLAAFNNRANAYRELGQYEAALANYRSALDVAVEMDSALLEARILTNIAALHARFDAFDEAERALEAARARTAGAGAGEWTRFIDGVRAITALGRGELDQARRALERTFEGVPLEQTPQHYAEFHNAGADLYARLDQLDMALAHLHAFKRLDDRARDVAASANSALLGAQFEFAEQNLQIEQLRAQQLEQHLALEREQAQARFFAFAGLLALIICLLVLGYARYRTERARKKSLAAALYNDAETQLPSRTALERVIEQRESEGRPSYVLAIEVNRHEHLRAALGFTAFSTLLQSLAKRLHKDYAPDHVGVIAPGVLGVLLDADEVHDAIHDEGDDALMKIVETLRKRLAAPVQIGEINVDVTTTCGAALHDLEECDESAFRRAVIALEQAQTARRTFATYDPVQFGDPAQNLTLMSRLQSAVANGDVTLHYQPKLNLRTGRFESAEALMRWNDPERGYIPPDAYIPFAEQTGRIRELTEWSLMRALVDQMALSKAGHPMSIAVNISSVLCTDDDFVAKAVRFAGQSTDGLIFEVTESAVMYDVEKAIRALELWTKAGATVSIDDYGTGQSSLVYLKRLPVQELKLDRAFVKDVVDNNKDRMLVRSTVDLAHNLGLKLTAEGVEDDETLNVLKLLGCDSAQGFGLCRPISLIDLVGFLQRHNEEAPAVRTEDSTVARQQGQ
ncbi:MAG: EAL domain-containing protein [Oceanicaulis sp.]|nr:EAL domain-containing protein [Oceanicaulis sp.]